MGDASHPRFPFFSSGPSAAPGLGNASTPAGTPALGPPGPSSCTVGAWPLWGQGPCWAFQPTPHSLGRFFACPVPGVQPALLRGRDLLSNFRERGREKEGEKHQCVVPLTYPPMRDQDHNPGVALTGNRTQDPSVHRPALNPLSHTSQVKKRIFLFVTLRSAGKL